MIGELEASFDELKTGNDFLEKLKTSKRK